jgi:hypothetical protein
MHPTGNYPAVLMRETKAYSLAVQSLTDRNNIPANFRDTGMIILVRDSSAFYSLVGGIANINWVKVGNASGGIIIDSVLVTNIDSIFITNSDSIFIVSGNDTIFIGIAGNQLANFYLKDSSLSSDRTVDLNGHFLSFNYNSTQLTIDPTVGNEQIGLLANDNTGSGNRAQFNGNSSPTQAQTYAKAVFNDGDKTSQILLYADVGESEIDYTADTNVFSGNLQWKTPVLGAANDSLLSMDSAGNIHYISKSSLPFSNQFLTAGYGILGFNYNGSAPQTWSVDTSLIANKTYVNAITGQDTAVWIVDSIACDTTGLLASTDYLVCATPVNGFAGHRNQIATKTGSVWNYQTPSNGDVLSDANPISYYQYDSVNALWKLINRAVLVGYANYGGVLTIGTSTKNNIRLGTRNGLAIVIDTNQRVALPKYISTRSTNYLFVDSITGNIDTGFFKPLVAGTNITINSGNSGDTINASGGGGIDSTTASNGLTKVVKDIQLGGTLTKIDTITGGSNYLFFTGSAGSNGLVNVNATTGVGIKSTVIQGGQNAVYGVQSVASSGAGVRGDASGAAASGINGVSISTGSSSYPGLFDKQAGTGTVDAINIKHTTGTPNQNNYGVAMLASITDSNVALQSVGRVSWLLDSNGLATKTSSFRIQTVRGSSLADRFTIQKNGQYKFNDYGLGTYTGTPAFALNVDASGNIIEGTVGGGGSTLTRQIITSGSSGTVTGGNYIVTIDPSATLAAYTLTLPASPTDLQTVEVDFGGTLTSGTIVTALVISPNSGQTILDNTAPTTATADNTLLYRYRASNTTWYRFKP